jgi:sirohydrochlorin ferrochelatase
MSAREINDETEIFTEALGASLAQGNLTVDQLKRQLEGGLAYVEALGADNVAEELLVALAALDKLLQKSQRKPSASSGGMNLARREATRSAVDSPIPG